MDCQQKEKDIICAFQAKWFLASFVQGSPAGARVREMRKSVHSRAQQWADKVSGYVLYSLRACYGDQAR